MSSTEDFVSNSDSDETSAPISQPHSRRQESENIKVEDNCEERKRYSRFREKQFICDECDRSFTMKQNIAHHFFLYHHPRLENYNRIIQEAVINYNCTKCDASFTEKEKAELHEQKAHAPPSKKVTQKCDRCDKIFSTASLLKEHIQVTHENLKPYNCEQCGQAFGTSSGLRRHRQMVHENKLYKCTYETCDHPGYRCSKALAAHIRSAHTHERPFGCEECGKHFFRKNDLRVHLLTHQKGKKFSCKICGVGFKTYIYLRKHRLTCGKKNNTKKLSKKKKNSKKKIESKK